MCLRNVSPLLWGCIVSFLFCPHSQTMDKLKLEAKFQMYRITVSTKFNGLTKELKDTFGLFEV